jgi:hypothetical protein
MVRFSALVTAAAVLATGLGAEASAQARSYRDPAYSLGQTIASTAAMAEHTAASNDGVQPAVRSAVERTIINAAAEPAVVLAALDTALAACRPANGRVAPDWTCPASPAAYLAIGSLRVIVVAQLEQIDPAALQTPGSSAFGSLMTTAPSANYINF